LIPFKLRFFLISDRLIGYLVFSYALSYAIYKMRRWLYTWKDWGGSDRGLFQDCCREGLGKTTKLMSEEPARRM